MKQEEQQQQLQEQQQPKNSARPVSDDELEAMTGGAADNAYPFGEYTRLCPHCLGSILTNMYEAHVEQCPKNPKNKK